MAYKETQKFATVYLNNSTIVALDKSNLLNFYSKSQLINYCLILQIPIICREKNINNSEIDKFISLAKRKHHRDIILMQRREEMRRAYFFSNFFKRVRKLTRDISNKQDIINIINLYIDESKTYLDFEKITDRLIQWKKGIKDCKSLKLVKAYMDIKVVEIKELEKERHKKIKNNEKRTN